LRGAFGEAAGQVGGQNDPLGKLRLTWLQPGDNDSDGDYTEKG
jgi:hypothetical protein